MDEFKRMKREKWYCCFKGWGGESEEIWR